MRTPMPRLPGRRVALRHIAVFPVAVASLAAAGCASRQKAPVPPPKPIALLAVLPTNITPTETNTGFRGANQSAYVPVQTGPRGSMSPGSAAAAIGVGLIVMAIAVSAAEQKKKEREALREALAQVDFDAAAALDHHLAAALGQRELRVLRITDPQIAAELRAGRFERLPPGVDAILDLEVSESGFYASSRAGGLSPMIQLTATVRPPAATKDDPDEYGYYADWRDGGADKRWLTTPKTLTFETVDGLKEHAAEARAGLDAIMQGLAALIADDLQRRTRGMPRID